MSTPAMSVIVAVYNQDRFLPSLLWSLERQDCPVQYEVLVCDDGSTDTTASQLARCTSLDLRHIWQPNHGFRVARSRNNGIRCAQGEVLVFLDGDSMLRPFFLRDHWDAHREAGRLVCGACQHVVTRGNIPLDAVGHLDGLPDQEVGSDRRERLAWLTSERPWMACTSGNMSIERTQGLVFDECFEGWGSEDRDFAYRAYQSGRTLFFLERVGLVHLRQAGETVDWNPSKGGNADSVVSALRSKLRLWHKYPGEVMRPSLDLVRSFSYDSVDDTWRVGTRRTDVSATAVLSQFEAWLAARPHGASASKGIRLYCSSHPGRERE